MAICIKGNKGEKNLLKKRKKKKHWLLLKLKVKKISKTNRNHWEKDIYELTREILNIYCIEEIFMSFWHQWQRKRWNWEKKSNMQISLAICSFENFFSCCNGSKNQWIENSLRGYNIGNFSFMKKISKI